MTSNEIIKEACEYYKQGKSLKEIAELLGQNHKVSIHPNTVKYHLKKSGIILRTNKEGITIKFRKGINVQNLLGFFNDSKSIREVSRHTNIHRGTIRKILVENGIIIMDSRSAQLAIGYIKEKEKFDLSIREKAYLYGLVLGDLTPVRKSDYTLKLITHSTHKMFMDLLQITFEKYGPTNFKETKNKNMFRFQSHLDLESFSFLLNSKQENIPEWINEENFFEFLAGFIDSDGSVMLKRAGKNIFYSIRLFGQNLNLLSQIKEMLMNLGYVSSIHLNHKKGDTSYKNGIMFRYNKDYYILETRKSHAIELLKKIPIRHKEKIMKRELIFKIYDQNINKWIQIEEEVNEVRALIKQSTY